MSYGNWLEADAFHVGADLLGDLLEDLLGQVAPAHALVELDELDDVSGALLPSRVSKPATITVKLFHRPEIGIAHANNDDGAGQLRQLADDIDGLWHVMDAPIRQKEQDLILVRFHCRLHVSHELGEQRAEQGRPAQSDMRQCLPVRLHYILDTADAGVARVAVHGEAVVDRVDAKVARNTAEAKHWEASVRIVWLDDLAHIVQRRLVLICASDIV